MSKIEFDEPRLKEMEDFLNYIYTIGIENPGTSINRGLVYRELCKYGIDSQELRADGTSINYSYLFNKWIDRNNAINSRSKGLGLKHKFTWPHFLQFFSVTDYLDTDEELEFIKLYIPMKYKGLFDSVNVLFDYIRDNDISHLSRVSDKIRTDNVVIRLRKDDLESALKIINFIKNDNAIRENLNKPNPFIPTVSGIGFMYETGISYTEDMSTLIVNYIKECIRLNKVPTIKEFYLWFVGNNYKEELMNIFTTAVGADTFTVLDEEKEMSDSEKNRLFKDAIKATFLKYDMDQVMYALKLALEEGNFSPFSNGNGEVKYRAMLRKNVTKEDAIRYVEVSLQDEDDINYDNVLRYCENVLKDELLKDFCAACLVTYENHDKDQLKIAIKTMIVDDNPSVFSRYSKKDIEHNKNYRTVVATFESNGVLNLIKLFLTLNHIEYDSNNIDGMIDSFTETLIRLNYQNVEDTIKIK